MRAEGIALDQAAGLRRLNEHKPVQVISVTGGKGGVGKTTVSLNLAIALSKLGREVMVLDADLGLANVDVLLGLRPRHNLGNVLEGTAALEDIILEGPAGVKLVPATSGLSQMTQLSSAEHAGLIHLFEELPYGLDALVIDTAAGISNSVVSFSRAAREIVVVVCDEPASITDAYAFMKLMHRENDRHRFRILANMVHSAAQGRELFTKLLRVSERFLSVSLDYMGAIPFDDVMRKSIQRQRAVVDAYPRSKSALAFKKLATTADRWPIGTASGQLEFFLEQLVQSNSSREEVQL